MKNRFEKAFNQMMSEEKEIPAKVRHSLDQSYDLIKEKSKKKKARFVWKRVTAAACALIVTGAVLTNEHVMAGINEFFNFGDKGIERAIKEGFTQENNSKATDQNISVTLERHFSDSNKIGMSFLFEFKDHEVLNNIAEIHMDYRLKNGDGGYIHEFIPDTKQLKGTNHIMSGVKFHAPILNAKTGKVQLDIVVDSHKGLIPPLENAVIEIETINIFTDHGELYKIDGEWELAFNNQNQENLTVQYAMRDEASIIHISSAKASPTSFNVSLSLDGTYENENIFAHRMRIIDENGNEYEADSGFSIDVKNNKTYISTNFPLTSYNNFSKLTLLIEEIGEVDLIKE